MKLMPHENKSIQLAIDAAGGLRPLARQLGIKHSSIAAWARIPLRHLFTIEELTGIPREKLRPDIFKQPRPRLTA
jgi:DNA-binding transcriptional regulator YdaS (Cro superfamily)